MTESLPTRSSATGGAREAPATLRVDGAADLLDLVPHLLGFHPSDSLVFVALRGPKHSVAVTLRVDLASVTASPPATEACIHHLTNAGADGVVLVVYADDPGPTADAVLPHHDVICEVASALGARDIGLVDALLVCRDRWWCYLCDDPGCCPRDGRQMRGGQSPSPMVVAATVAGMAAAPDRAALERSLAPLPDAERSGVRRAVDRLVQCGAPASREDVRALWSEGVAAQVEGETAIPDDDAAALLIGLTDDVIRDECCGWAGGTESGASRMLARQLARRASPPWDVVPYTMLAWFAWRSGEGAQARIAVDHALAGDPDYRLALLLEAALDDGVDPRRWHDPPPTAPSSPGRG